ncbi:zinc-binding dehydrogenase [Mycolicibacterium sp. F2034L]|uniref:zinc-binding dehydrogenase n=1 Tax=Mycolicibacterium sp. F2034L TaxID=2926422 RepID=UPI001FF4DF90|nr:zinc-binding dehydrogenase [Mycolicibacterium sp. F2034L]MCK0174574.1 zinc-binding dehydrogenase [Mycolicibacterium sp. F2034L]
MDPVAPGVTRAAVWTGDGVQLRTVPLPARSDGSALVRVRLATVCGSDLHTVEGRRAGPAPSVLGHEAVGDVVDPGAHPGLAIGDRVVWSVTASCGSCARCRAGRSAKCEVVRKAGHEPFEGAWPLSGAYAEHVVLPTGVAVERVPDGLDDRVAAPAGCATATVMATLEAAGPLTGRRVLICGAGMLGVTAAAACAEAGADVWISDPDAVRVGTATRFGAIADSGGAVDVAIDFSGATVAVAGALGRLDVGGVLVLAGSVLPCASLIVDPETMVRRWLTITGVHNYEPRHLREALMFLNRTRGEYPWRDVVSDPVRLEAIHEALTVPPAGILRAAVAP